MDYVFLFSDSTIKAATNAQQWYVTISRGRRGITAIAVMKVARAEKQSQADKEYASLRQ